MKKNWYVILTFVEVILVSVVFCSCDSEVNDGNNTIPKIVMALQDKSPYEADEYLIKKGYDRQNMDSFPEEFEFIAPVYTRANVKITIASLYGESTPYHIIAVQSCSSVNQAFQKYKSWIEELERNNKNPDLWFADIIKEGNDIFDPDYWYQRYYCGGPIGEEFLKNADSLGISGTRDDFKQALFWVNPEKLLQSEVREIFADQQQMGHMVQTRYPAYLTNSDRNKTVSFIFLRGDMSQYLIPGVR